MSGPYVYTPPGVQYASTPYVQSHHSPVVNSPYIPPQTFKYSPYAQPGSLPHTPPTPYAHLPHHVLFPSTGDPNIGGAWDYPQRQRRLSGYGGTDNAHYYTPYIAPPTGHVRRHSFNGQFQPPPFQTTPAAFQTPLPPSTLWHPPGAVSTLQMHPGLDGLNWRGQTFINLSMKVFNPSKSLGNGQYVLLSPEDLSHTATWPPITQLRIICDMIPQWPIDLILDEYGVLPGTLPPPITIYDVLYRIHTRLHEQITHDDWRMLPAEKESAVSRAFTKRCKLLPQEEDSEIKRGVKRVDFLLNKVWFKGLVPVPGHGMGFEVAKLIVSRSSHSQPF